VETYTPEKLFAGSVMPKVADVVTILAGQKLVRGSALGLVKKAVGTIAAPEANTGDATIATAALAAHAQVGVYTITCINAPSAASANDAVFSVKTPAGLSLANATQNVEYTGGHLIFKISAATDTDSKVGDVYTIPVVAGSEKAKLVDKTAVDGSENIYAILAEDVDATDGAKPAPIYITGEFNQSAIILADDTTVADVKTAARALGIFLKSTVSA
jgi:hypothetical protein